MKFKVRTQDGELDYQSFGQVEQAWLMGLIEPDDEILEEGHTRWRKARSIPLLAQARRSGDQVWAGTWFIWTLVGVVGGTVALYFFHEKNYLMGLVIAFADAALMFQVTMKAYQKQKPHR